MEIRELVLLDGVRTPMAEFCQSFADLSALDLGTLAAKGVLERAAIDPEVIDHTFIGNALQTSPDAIYGARNVALRADIPKSVWSVVWRACRRLRTASGERGRASGSARASSRTCS